MQPFGERPSQLTIGVTGHRAIGRPGGVAAAVRRALELIDPTRSQHHDGVPPAYTVLSALAEGADRIVAQEILARSGGRLEAVLPMPAVEYADDFRTPASRKEFKDLLECAALVHVMGPAQDREHAYLAAGRFIVDRCHALIVVWDGESAAGIGGTSDVVAYARSSRPLMPLVWIRADDPAIVTREPAAEQGARPIGKVGP